MRSARFIKSATRREEYPTLDLPQIAFAGRSNVGKSSLINRLVGRKNLARTSSTPGRTQIVNFFAVDEKWVLVDLPGYGYARVPERIRAEWAPMIEEYLTASGKLRLVVAIVDARHRPTELDVQMLDWLEHYEIPCQVVATKVDKLSKNQQAKSLKQVSELLRSEEVIAFSAVTGWGKKQLWARIENAI